eukprot:TRINITY_DN15276_c0_g1_i6.p1 TRINITY_DN15276_c0_g1~~TRINITY_DN15276_c0_g1_i6.p1  ORF type:complete len:534 (-),score=73.92 TRINITY_DN15276_c0_g1_i6:125-1726(-)
MKILILVSFFLAFSIAAINVVPYPRDIEFGTETIQLSHCSLYLDLPLTLGSSYHSVINANKGLVLGDERLCRDAENSFPIKIAGISSSQCESEEYRLEVTSEGIDISVDCPVGVVRAFATLYQLMQTQNELLIIENVPLKIRDGPRFQYRGLMVDSSRHFLPLPILRRIIDGMCLAKLNKLHWHLVDDDSFTMQSIHIPGLAEKAAFSEDMMYTKTQIEEFVHYAKQKGVDIIPEIDCPGHSRAIGKFAPLSSITTCFNRTWPHKLADYFIIHGGPPTSALDPSMDLTYDYLEKVFRDLAHYFEHSFVHLGGDEVVYSCWKERKSIDDFMKRHKLANHTQLMNFFINKARGVLRKVDSRKKAIYWSNKRTENVRYADDDILQFWGPMSLIHSFSIKYPKNKFILSPTDMLYISSGFGNRYGTPGGTYRTWLEIYLFEPSNYGMPESMIIGAEACTWGEMADESNLEVKIWPRALGLAETLWSPKRGTIDMISVVRRMNELAAKLRSLKIPCGPITSQYCEAHINDCFQRFYHS